MSDRFINSGVLVVYENGDQFFNEKESALKFADWMEAMGYMCEFYIATIEHGVVARRRWIDRRLLKDAVLRSERPRGRVR